MSNSKSFHSFEHVLQNVPKTKLPVLTVITDFGSADGFVGVMKGVILQIAPQAKIVDISHDLPPFSIEAAAFLNQWSYGYFPQGSAHLCVVDPGVGTIRRMLAVEVSGHFFIAPDNGVLSPILRINEPKTVVSITNSKYWLDKISHTFHGRDIFSPVAAHLAAGVDIVELGERIDDPVMLLEMKANMDNDTIYCQIEYIDRFGNLITSLSSEQFLEWEDVYKFSQKKLHICIGDNMIHGISTSYGECNPGELLAVFDGYNRLEISVNQGSAQKATGLKYGDEVKIKVM